LFLIKNGISEQTAVNLTDAERAAYCIIFSEITTGRKFNFMSNSFEDS
jgi:hypothetical protein